jgi:hypothetical protein
MTTFIAQTWHITKKDLRAVAIVALFWIFLMSIEVALQFTGGAARPRGLGRASPLETMIYFLPFAELMTIVLIVSLVIHEDPLVDARAFWLTRAIPRGPLFVSKLTTIALVIFTPAFVALVMLLAWYHVPPLYMMRAGLEVVFWLALPLLFLTAAATLTSSPPRYLLLLFGLVVTTITFFGMMETFSERALPGGVYEPRLPRLADPARQVVISLLLIAGLSAAIHRFYRRRDWRVALGGIALVAAVAAAVARYAPPFRFFAPLGEATGAWADPAVTRLRMLEDRPPLVSAYHPRELRSVAAPLVLDGLPEGYSASPFTLSGQLTRADGTVLRSGRALPMQVDAKGEYQPTLTLTYQNDPIDAGPTRWESWPVLLMLPSGHRTRARQARGAEPRSAADADGSAYYAGAYTGTFLYRIARHEKVAALRLDRRAAYADGPRGIRVVDVKDFGGFCRVTVEVTNIELTFAGPTEPSAGYYFVDRPTGETLRGTRLSTSSGMLGPLRAGLPPGRRIFTAAAVEWDIANSHNVSRSQGGRAAFAPCADIDLIFVRTIAAGSLTRSITLPDFRVQPSQDRFFRR